MMMPSKVKYRKQQRGRMRGKATRGSTLAFGDTGLQILEPGWITARQIEAARIAMTRAIKRGGKVWIRIFPDKPYTKKPAEIIEKENQRKEAAWKLRLQKATGQLENPSRLSILRRDIARVKTYLRAVEQAEKS